MIRRRWSGLRRPVRVALTVLMSVLVIGTVITVSASVGSDPVPGAGGPVSTTVEQEAATPGSPPVATTAPDREGSPVSTTRAIPTTAAGPTPATSASPVPTTTSVVRTTTTGAPAIGAPVAVVAVLDGDTVDVRGADGVVERVRLIGINSPERDECHAEAAGDALRDLVGDGMVGMTSDVSDRDQFGRLLRYLWLPDGRFVNEELVAAGHAIARRYPPDVEHADRLAAAQMRAESAGDGLWAADACGGPLTDARLRIVDIRYDAPGNDNENLSGEWVDIGNDGTPVDMTGWVLKDGSASHRYQFPEGFRLEAGAAVRVSTGCGVDDSANLYWCKIGSAVWNNDGDTGFLLDPDGNIADLFRY